MSKLAQYYYNGVVEAQKMVIRAMLDQDDYRILMAEKILDHAQTELKNIMKYTGEL